MLKKKDNSEPKPFIIPTPSTPLVRQRSIINPGKATALPGTVPVTIEFTPTDLASVIRKSDIIKPEAPLVVENLASGNETDSLPITVGEVITPRKIKLTKKSA